jgi:hypothetical protein
LVFKNYGNGLKIKTGDTELMGFTLAGSDKIFRATVGKIINDSTIILESSLVSLAVAARYAWSKNPICNLYNSDNLPASPFRTDTWISGFAYQAFPSTCALSDDKNLIGIKINGFSLSGFQPSVLTYQLQETFQNIPDIKGFTNNPFAKIATTVSGTGSQQKVILTVTAENGSSKEYEIGFNLQTSNLNNFRSEGIRVYKNGNNLIVINESVESVPYKIYNVAGINILSGEIANKSQQQLKIINRGMYFVRFDIAEIKINKKFVI